MDKKAEKEKEKERKRLEKEEAKQRKLEEKARKEELKKAQKELKKNKRKSNSTPTPAIDVANTPPTPDNAPEVTPPTSEPAPTVNPVEVPAEETEMPSNPDGADTGADTASAPLVSNGPAPEKQDTQELSAGADADPKPEVETAANPAPNLDVTDAKPEKVEATTSPEASTVPAVEVTEPSPVAKSEVPDPGSTFAEAVSVRPKSIKRVTNLSRNNSARRSLHGAPVPQADGVTVLPHNAAPQEVDENMIGVEVVEDECDETVGNMASDDALKTAEFLMREVEAFKSRIIDLQDNGTNMGYSRAYNAMSMVGRDQPSEHSQREANKLKNRYGNIMAYDHSRVVLPQSGEDPDTQYINANWVDGYKKKRQYIASQGPVPNSFISFWRMIWHMGVETIVMVTHEIEKGRMKCHRYWPDPTSSPPIKSMQYGLITVSHLSSVPHKHFVVRTFDVSCNGETRTVKHFAYTSWPDHGVPLTTQELLGFRNAIQTSIENEEAPQVIHCSAGVGRTGTYIAIDKLMRSALDMHGPLNVDNVIREMRMARNFMVQTEIQYMFIYRAVLDAILDLLSGESSKAQAKVEDANNEEYERQREQAMKEEEARKAVEQAEIEEARKELLARTDNSANAAAQVVSMSIKDRVKLLQNAEERWLQAYRQSMEEWSERNQFEAETYDLSSALTPIQSRLEALQQKGIIDQL